MSTNVPAVDALKKQYKNSQIAPSPAVNTVQENSTNLFPSQVSTSKVQVGMSPTMLENPVLPPPNLRQTVNLILHPTRVIQTAAQKLQKNPPSK